MKRVLKSIGIGVFVLALAGAWSGCAATQSKAPGVGIGGVHLDALKRNEYVIMDTVEGQGKSTRFLCFSFPLREQYGYTEIAGAEGWASVKEPGLLTKALGGGMDVNTRAKAAALFNALQQVPTADALLPMTTTIESTRFPILYKSSTATVRTKGIRIKTDTDLGL